MSERDDERALIDEAGALDRPPGLETQRLRSALQSRLFGTPAAPTRIGRYVVVEPLGQGAMGTVYRAVDPDLDRRVAVKVLREGSGSDLSRARLAREAKIMARLAHPNVVAVYEVGMAAGEVFIAMESVDGGTLADWCTANALGTRDRCPRVLELALQAARGLAAAHGAGLVHRDLKPSNLLIGEDGRLRVADFGLARPHAELMASESGVPVAHASVAGSVSGTSSSSLDVRLTATGEAVGTPAYMAPEQFAGRADATSDQFAFCVTFYEALYGVRPFAGRTTAELRESIGAQDLVDMPPVAGVPVWVRRMLRRGLASEPSRRWPSMDAIVGEIERRGRARRSRTVGVAALGGLAFSAFFVARPGDPDPITPCSDDLDRLEPHWGSERRAAMRAAFLRSGAPHADDTWARVEHRMDEITGQWSAARLQACRDGREPDPERVASSRARAECLERGLGTFELVSTTFATADTQTVQRAVPIVLAAADQIGCDDRRAREHHDERLDEVVLDALDEASLLRAGRRGTDAAAAIEAVLPRLPPSGYLRAKALHDLAASRVSVAAPAAEQRDAATQALESAELIDDAVLLAHAWRLLAHAELAGNDHDAAERSVARARNVASRPEVPEVDRARVTWTQALTLAARERFAEAAPLFDTAIEVYRRERPQDAVLAHLLHDATGTFLFSDAPERAADAVAEAVATCERVLGPVHPETGRSLVLQAQIDHQLGRPGVLEALERAEPILLADADVRTDVLVDLHMVRSHALERAGRTEESLAAIEAAIDTKTKRDGPDAPFQLVLGSFRAAKLERLERYDESRAEYRRLIDRFATREDVNRRALGNTRLGLAFLEAEHGDRAVARTELEAARAILDAMHDRSTAPGYLHFLNVAKVLRSAGDSKEALAILRDLARRSTDTAMPDRILATMWLDTAHTQLALGDRTRAREAIENARQPVRAADPEGTAQAVQLLELEAAVDRP